MLQVRRRPEKATILFATGRLRAIEFKDDRRWYCWRNVKAASRGIVMNLPQLSHALESPGDANTYTGHINDVERRRRHISLGRSAR